MNKDIVNSLKKDSKYTVRTQISLSKTLKDYVDYLSREQEKSISQIIRESLIENIVNSTNADLAIEGFLDSNDKTNKNWESSIKTEKWLKNLRKDK